MTRRLRQRWLLAVLVAGQFMANVDIAIVNVATPSIHRDLHASGGALEFVVSGYVLAFVALGAGGFGLGMSFSSLLGRLTAVVPPDEAADLSGLVNTSAQVAAVAGVAAYGTVYFALAGRPAHAFTVSRPPSRRAGWRAGPARSCPPGAAPPRPRRRGATSRLRPGCANDRGQFLANRPGFWR
jgi:hypothetical protein